MIVDPPDNLHDVAGWQEAVDELKAARDRVPADLYDALMASLVDGLRYAETAVIAPTTHGNMRDRIRAARAG